MAASPVPPDLPAPLWMRVRGDARFVSLARRPSDDAPLLVVCAPLDELADLAGGFPAVWTDLEDPQRLAGPRIVIVALPEPGTRLADRLDAAKEGDGHWPFACSPDLAHPASRETCARIAADEVLNVALCEPGEAQVVSRLAFQISDETVATLHRVIEAASERWPTGRAL
jgi:hypothetical protein